MSKKKGLAGHKARLEALKNETETEKKIREAGELQRSHHASNRLDAQVELGFKHGREMNDLKSDQETRNGDYAQSLVDQERELEKALNAKGLAKIVRDVTGQAKQDENDLKSVQLSLDDVRTKNQQEIDVMQKRHSQEERELRDAHHKIETQEIKRQEGNETQVQSENETQTAPNLQQKSKKTDSKLERGDRAWEHAKEQLKKKNEQSKEERENLSENQDLEQNQTLNS